MYGYYIYYVVYYIPSWKWGVVPPLPSRQDCFKILQPCGHYEDCVPSGHASYDEVAQSHERRDSSDAMILSTVWSDSLVFLSRATPTHSNPKTFFKWTRWPPVYLAFPFSTASTIRRLDSVTWKLESIQGMHGTFKGLAILGPVVMDGGHGGSNWPRPSTQQIPAAWGVTEWIFHQRHIHKHIMILFPDLLGCYSLKN